MAEYIEREAVLQAVLELPPKMDEQGYGWLGRRGVWQMLLDFPSADVAPVRHGRWIDDKVAFYLGCSECGCYLEYAVDTFLDNGDHYHYCPNCGASMMDGETR